MHAKNERHRLNSLLFSARCRYTKIAQRIFKHSGIEYTNLTRDRKLNRLIYRTLFYTNIYESYKLLKTVRFFGPPCIYIYIYIYPHTVTYEAVCLGGHLRGCNSTAYKSLTVRVAEAPMADKHRSWPLEQMYTTCGITS